MGVIGLRPHNRVMTHLTDNEKNLIKAIGHSEYRNGQTPVTIDNPVWVDCIWGFEGKAKFGGTMASLKTKGLAGTDGECCWLTDAGLAVLAEIDAQGTVAEAMKELQTRVQKLAEEIPGISFGYIGNCGVDSRGPFDETSWYVFLPAPMWRTSDYRDRVGGFSRADLPKMLADWVATEATIRRKMAGQCSAPSV